MSSAPNRAYDTSRQPELSFPAYRGVFVPGEYHSSNSGLGLHWSASQKVAEEMGSHAWYERSNGMGTHPRDRIVVHNAEIPLSSVETDTNVLKKNKVFSPENLNENSEEEVPVKKGKTVRVKSTSISTRARTRTRNYNPPREMKA